MQKMSRNGLAIQIFRPFTEVHYTKEVGHLAHHVAKAGWDVRLLVERRPKKDDSFLPKIIALGDRFWFKALRTVWDLRPDLVLLFHSHPMNPLVAVIARLRNHKVIVYAKGDMSETVLNPTALVKRCLRHLKIRLNLVFLDLFSVEQQRVYDWICSHHARYKRKILLLPSGFGERSPPALLPWSKKKNRILVVGRLGSWQKATDTVLEVLGQLDLRDWEVLLVGSVEPNFDAEEYYSKYPQLRKHVRFHGQTKKRSEMLHLYNTSKILFMPSRYEGFSNVPAEAAYFGMVIIGTPVGGIVELTKNGSIGAVCPIDAVLDLAAQLRKRLSDASLLERESRASRTLCLQQFLWSAIVSKLLSQVRKSLKSQ